MDTPVNIQQPEYVNLPVEKIGGLNQAIMFAFLCNKIGNFVGWGTLLAFMTGIFIDFTPLIFMGAMVGMLILPILILVFLLINLGVVLALLWLRLLKGSFPKFYQKRDYFIKGAISSSLFLFGSISYVIVLYFYLSALAAFPE